MYIITSYTVEKINCDNNGAYKDPKSVKIVFCIRKWQQFKSDSQCRGQTHTKREN